MNRMKLLQQTTVIGLVLLFVVGCGAPATPAPTFTPIPPTATLTPMPTATLPAKVDSSLKSKLLGQWKISGETKVDGAWGDAILTFSDDGNFSVIGGLQEKEAKGNYFFTSENTIAFSLPDYQGSVTLEFTGNDQMSLTVTKSNEIFGLIYSAERVNGNKTKLSLEWLVTADEINSFSKDIGVVQWELVDQFSGENAVRHTFKGTSWSSNPNEALNSINKIFPGSTFEDIIKSMFDSGNLFASAVPVKSSLNFDGDFAVYAGTFPNGHSVYDLLLVKNNLFYWASVSLGTPVGDTPESLYESNREAIDAFLSNLIMINLERSK